jgi:hypothetical protein
MRNKLFTAFEARKENKFCRKNKIYAGTWTVSPSFKRRQLINEHIKHNIMSIATTNFRTSNGVPDAKTSPKGMGKIK